MLVRRFTRLTEARGLKQELLQIFFLVLPYLHVVRLGNMEALSERSCLSNRNAILSGSKSTFTGCNSVRDRRHEEHRRVGPRRGVDGIGASSGGFTSPSSPGKDGALLHHFAMRRSRSHHCLRFGLSESFYHSSTSFSEEARSQGESRARLQDI